MVPEASDRERFYDLFSPVCHDMAIEHLTPTVQGVDYSKITDGRETDKPQNGETFVETGICPQPFYLMQINPDGGAVPCCSMRYPLILGNANKESVRDIWNGIRANRFRLNLLEGVENAGGVCGSCKLYLYGTHAEDRLDGCKETLIAKYREMGLE
jgi:MoaA/NifB/PqqE/SkfB family radical SAM enzyme